MTTKKERREIYNNTSVKEKKNRQKYISKRKIAKQTDKIETIDTKVYMYYKISDDDNRDESINFKKSLMSEEIYGSYTIINPGCGNNLDRVYYYCNYMNLKKRLVTMACCVHKAKYAKIGKHIWNIIWDYVKYLDKTSYIEYSDAENSSETCSICENTWYGLPLHHIRGNSWKGLSIYDDLHGKLLHFIDIEKIQKYRYYDGLNVNGANYWFDMGKCGKYEYFVPDEPSPVDEYRLTLGEINKRYPNTFKRDSKICEVCINKMKDAEIFIDIYRY